MDNGLGVLVWATLIVGSGAALFLALRDVLVWCVGLMERMHGTDREASGRRAAVPTIPVAVERSSTKTEET